LYIYSTIQSLSIPTATATAATATTTARYLTTSELQHRYIQALNVAFQQGALQHVVQVKQIECEGFLGLQDALTYINEST